mmetsp:Transcript_42845/g.93215  ORF Transcript_42845/g.93215 Transcript_42845/m.93215 type:complete len:218 (+) Transcript_42845:225-878(+)
MEASKPSQLRTGPICKSSGRRTRGLRGPRSVWGRASSLSTSATQRKGAKRQRSTCAALGLLCFATCACARRAARARRSQRQKSAANSCTNMSASGIPKDVAACKLLSTARCRSDDKTSSHRAASKGSGALRASGALQGRTPRDSAWRHSLGAAPDFRVNKRNDGSTSSWLTLAQWCKAERNVACSAAAWCSGLSSSRRSTAAAIFSFTASSSKASTH